MGDMISQLDETRKNTISPQSTRKTIAPQSPDSAVRQVSEKDSSNKLSRVQQISNDQWMGEIIETTRAWEVCEGDCPRKEEDNIRCTGVEHMEDETREKMMVIVAQLISGVDITEVYSPDRVCKIAREMGLKAGLSFDLTNGWDFNLEQYKKAAWDYIIRENHY